MSVSGTRERCVVNSVGLDSDGDMFLGPQRCVLHASRSDLMLCLRGVPALRVQTRRRMTTAG